MTNTTSNIKIAVFGTTSAGKSTFLNLLVGADLLPSGVQETTLGHVVIRHDQQRRLLATAAEVDAGTHTDLRSHEVYEKLTEQFAALRAGGTVAGDEVMISWPTQLGARLRQWGMRDFDLEIIDSPGLRFVGDDRHLVKRLDRTTHVAFVFGADETDDRKQFTLLRKVLDHVEDPTRLFFILNKVDVFLNDYDSHGSEQRFRKRLLRKVDSEIKERWEDEGPPEIVGVSARGAFYANLVRENSRFRFEHILDYHAQRRARNKARRALEFLWKHHRLMVSDELLNQFPQDIVHFSRTQRRAMIDAILPRTRYRAFARLLIERLRTAPRHIASESVT